MFVAVESDAGAPDLDELATERLGDVGAESGESGFRVGVVERRESRFSVGGRLQRESDADGRDSPEAVRRFDLVDEPHPLATQDRQVDRLAVGEDAVSICARLGSGEAPVDAGWFIHHIRSTPAGAEMRSRFWMGGPHIAVRNAPAVASKAVRPIASRVLGTSEATARNLLVHCAQEMNHLAGFLSELNAAFGDE
jgi:hypothetical protein